MILLPLNLFFHVIFFPSALKFPFPLYNLKFFPKGIDKLLPEGGVGNEELYTPLATGISGFFLTVDW